MAMKRRRLAGILAALLLATAFSCPEEGQPPTDTPKPSQAPLLAGKDGVAGARQALTDKTASAAAVVQHVETLDPATSANLKVKAGSPVGKHQQCVVSITKQKPSPSQV